MLIWSGAFIDPRTKNLAYLFRLAVRRQPSQSRPSLKLAT